MLVLDQLDQMTTKERVEAFEEVLFKLLDHSSNWYVIISLLDPVYEKWWGYLSEAMKRRLKFSGQGAPSLVQLQPITQFEDKRDLILRRLVGDLALKELREKHRIESNVYPLASDEINRLAGRGQRFPGDLLTEQGRLMMESTQSL